MLALRNTKWDKIIEVVVVGYGLAGAVAAISARDRGANVMLLEKQSADSHCSYSSMSGGLFVSPSDADEAAKYLRALYQVNGISWTDEDIIGTWAKYAVQNKDWIKGLGGNFEYISKSAEFPQLPGADSMELWRYKGSGLRMMQFMYQQVSSRNIEVMYQTTVQRLFTNQYGEVTGVRAIDLRNRENEINIKASKAVILCCGGFEANEEMKLQFLRVYPMYFTGGNSNTGDGIKMAQEVGADLWHMGCVSARLVSKFTDFPIAFSINFSGRNAVRSALTGVEEKAAAGYIIVDKRGYRYMNERLKPHAAAYRLTSFDDEHLEYSKVPSYYIFDQRRMEYNTLCPRTSGPAGPHQLYKWSASNMTELEKGWIKIGKTVAELAGKLGIPDNTLENTVHSWNKQCQEGKDSDFGRDPLELIPIDNPPFYAVRLFPGGMNTQGGPRRNSRAQVVNPYNEPIPRLYSAGECGSIYGMLYPGPGCNLAECITFGRIAAESAVT